MTGIRPSDPPASPLWAIRPNTGAPAKASVLPTAAVMETHSFVAITSIMTVWAIAAILVLAAPAADAQPPRLDVRIEQGDSLIAVAEPLEFTLHVDLQCANPPDPVTSVNLEPPSGNYFVLWMDPLAWDVDAQACAEGQGTVRQAVEGEFRFRRPMPPLADFEYPIPAFAGSDREVWAQGAATLVATPDAHLRIGGVLATPHAVTREGTTLRSEAVWTIHNHGTGAFVADIRIESAPSWMQSVLPSSVTSRAVAPGPPATATVGPGAGNATTPAPDPIVGTQRASFTLVATMPRDCPHDAAVITLALDVRSTNPRSRAHEQVRVQGILPCDPRLAAPGLAPGLLVPLMAALAHLRRRQEQKC